MSAIINVPAVVRELVKNDGRSYAWLAQAAWISRSTVVEEVLYETQPMGLVHALKYAEVFGLTLGQLIDAAGDAEPATAKAA
jgi:hypothetical protein